MPKINNKFIQELPLPEPGKQAFYWDDELSGFGLRVSGKKKVFIAQSRAKGKTVRVTIDSFPTLSSVDARARAKRLLADMSEGLNPNAQKQLARAKGVTLKEAFDRFIEVRTLKPKTVTDYRRCMELSFKDWHKKELLAITPDMVSKRHRKLGVDRGEAFANLSMRVLRALFNFAKHEYTTSDGTPIILHNPVGKLSGTKAWFTVDPRTGHLRPQELRGFFDAVEQLSNPIVRDYLTFVLMTGCRRMEAARLRWEDVDLSDRSFFIRDPKNKNPIRLPLSDYLVKMLENRRSESEWVFPADSRSGHIEEPKKSIAKVGDAWERSIRCERVSVQDALTRSDLKNWAMTHFSDRFGVVNIKSLGRFLSKNKGRIVAGMRIMQPATVRGVRLWQLERVSAAGPSN